MADKIQELKKNLKLFESTKDPEFKSLIGEEITRLEQEIVKADEEDAQNAILEIRAGTGGEEAELFGGELARMYLKFAERKGWKAIINDKKETTLGGIKELVATIGGENVYPHTKKDVKQDKNFGVGVYGTLKYEAGVHRVQRVPKTEKQGRIHTSAATVAVLPEIEEKQLEINPQDIRVDVYRSGGHGGQSER